nr:hypothetical protein GCM10020241_01360 [Streptoalloteichus tenebrarius]
MRHHQSLGLLKPERRPTATPTHDQHDMPSVRHAPSQTENPLCALGSRCDPRAVSEKMITTSDGVRLAVHDRGGQG